MEWQRHRAVKRVIKGRDRTTHQDEERSRYERHVNAPGRAVGMNRAGSGAAGERQT